MMDAFQSTSVLMRSTQTLAQSVSTPLTITHDCCDLVPMPRQLERRLRTISCRVMEGVREGRGGEMGRAREGRGGEMGRAWEVSGEGGEMVGGGSDRKEGT